MKTFPPAAITSPLRASWYCTRPVRGEMRTRSFKIDSMRSTSACALLIAASACSRCAIRALNASLCTLIIAPPLIERLLRDDLFADEFLPALEIRLGGGKHGLALVDHGFRFGQRLLSFVQIGLRRPQLCFIFRRGYAPDDLSSRNLAAFFDGDVGEPAGIFRGDVDLDGLDAAVGLVDALGHRSAEHAVKQTLKSRFRFRSRRQEARPTTNA